MFTSQQAVDTWLQHLRVVLSPTPYLFKLMLAAPHPDPVIQDRGILPSPQQECRVQDRAPHPMARDPALGCEDEGEFSMSRRRFRS
jgi:hypothetical protein